jgi:type VI secretion system protein ImpC
VVKHQLALKVNYLGAQELKNIRDAIHAYQLTMDTAPTRPAPRPASAAARVTSPMKGAGIAFQMTAGSATGAVRRTETTPFHVCLLGDFSGRSSRGVSAPLPDRTPVHVDVDNLDAVLSRVDLQLPVLQRPGEICQLHFRTLEDFHPDQLILQAPSLRSLAELRRRLGNPKTEAAALAELEALFGPATPAGPGVVETDSAMKERLLGRAALPSPPQPGATSLDTFIKKLAGADAVPDTTARRQEFVTRLDLELTRQLRAILHHPDFQQLEAAWRCVQWLVQEFGGEETVKLWLVDASKDEVMADIGSPDESGAGLHRLLAQQPWGLLLGNYTFGDTLEELESLDRLAQIASTLGAPFVAGAHPHLAGCPSFSEQPDPQDWTRTMMPEVTERWTALRQSPAADHLGLVAPRFLLRQPYGQGSDPIERFLFEELPETGGHDFYLWGNPAFLCGHVFCEAFLQQGWKATSTRAGRVHDRPVHTSRASGENQVKSWAEIWMTERGADGMLKKGLIPIMALKNRNAIDLPNLQSVALPSKPLAWQRA